MAESPSPEPTEAFRKYFALEVAELKITGAMRPNEVIIVPLREPADGQVTDLTFLATSPHKFIKLAATPHSVV